MSIPRILIFSHDGRGLGHLRRLSHLGKALQGRASVLFLTGLREASWLVPPSCEFVHVPSRDSLTASRSRQWQREPFIPQGTRHSFSIRNSLIKATVEAFEPDALIVDYLPLGIDEEIAELVFGLHCCKKYYISRGVLGDPTSVKMEVLTPRSVEALRTRFHRIFVMSDPKIVNTIAEYGLDNLLANKVVYTGYAVDPPNQLQIDAVRDTRGIPSDVPWIVCSAGGGKDGEDLIQKCWEISQMFPDAYFDIIAGPRSRLRFSEQFNSGNRVMVRDADIMSLPIIHAAADVVITRGGYNSLMEASIGSAKIIVVPISWDYEQRDHARRLSTYRDLRILHDLHDLDIELEKVMGLGRPLPLDRRAIRLDGAQTTAALILDDLCLEGKENITETPDRSYAL
jgi:predicted glycosyltransferase